MGVQARLWGSLCCPDAILPRYTQKYYKELKKATACSASNKEWI
jgi:hypothetical protein